MLNKINRWFCGSKITTQWQIRLPPAIFVYLKNFRFLFQRSGASPGRRCVGGGWSEQMKWIKYTKTLMTFLRSWVIFIFVLKIHGSRDHASASRGLEPARDTGFRMFFSRNWVRFLGVNRVESFELRKKKTKKIKSSQSFGFFFVINREVGLTVAAVS